MIIANTNPRIRAAYAHMHNPGEFTTEPIVAWEIGTGLDTPLVLEGDPGNPWLSVAPALDRKGFDSTVLKATENYLGAFEFVPNGGGGWEEFGEAALQASLAFHKARGTA